MDIERLSERAERSIDSLFYLIAWGAFAMLALVVITQAAMYLERRNSKGGAAMEGEREDVYVLPEERERPLIVGMKLHCPRISEVITGKDCEDQRVSDRYFCSTCLHYLKLMGL